MFGGVQNGNLLHSHSYSSYPTTSVRKSTLYVVYYFLLDIVSNSIEFSSKKIDIFKANFHNNISLYTKLFHWLY